MALGNRNSQHSFAVVPSVHMARSSFDRSFGIKDTFDFDYLVPIFVDEMLPGDTANVNANVFARLATQKVPIMDNMKVDVLWFWVPSRILWDNWQKFMGAQENPGDSTDYLIPQTPTGSIGQDVGTIFDKFGIPTGIPDLSVNALPFRAYNLIYNTWFRDQDLQDSLPVPKDNGPDLITYEMVKRGKCHDYFTSARPWPQKGPAVDLPLGLSAPVLRTPNAPNWTAYLNLTNTAAASTGIVSSSGTLAQATPLNGISLDPAGGLYTDLSDATAATINQLREAFQVQSILELDARRGTRYVEVILAHFNVVLPDYTAQRPELLGIGSTPINAHPVPQTAPTAGTNAQAQLAAYATASSSGSNLGFTKSFVEHGYVIGLACARADITYQQGLNKMWSRQTRFDFFWPKLQELGEQAILNKEICALGEPRDEEVFGYQERYAEYRYKPSEIHGEFRSQFPQSLDFWHLAEYFDPDFPPNLSNEFIQQNTPIERALAVTGAPHLLFDCFFKYTHARPMLTYSTPLSLGRF